MMALKWINTIAFAVMVTVNALANLLPIGGNRIAAIAVMWAYAGILIRHISVTYYAGSHPFVIAAGFLSEAVILAAILMPVIEQIIKKTRYVSVH